MLPTRTVSYKDETYDLEIIVKQVTAREGIRRMVLQQQARRQQPKEETIAGVAPDDEDAALALLGWNSLALGTYSSCLAATVSIKSKDKDKPTLSPDMPLSEFEALPETLTELWESAVEALNPQWYRWQQQGNSIQPSVESASTGKTVSTDN